jgi:hypothetical protein
MRTSPLATSPVVQNILDNKLGQLNHQSPKLCVFFLECTDVCFVNVTPERWRIVVVLMMTWPGMCLSQS